MPLDSYVTLGRSGLRVSPFTLGTMTFGDDWGWGADADESEAMLSEYLDRGGNFIDTANVYTNGHAETIVGEYFARQPERRDRVVIGSKFFGNLYAGDPNGGGAGRKAIVQQLEQSLRRLRTDYVDVYWLHNWDRAAPVEETLRTLDDLVAAGKIRYIGFSRRNSGPVDTARSALVGTPSERDYDVIDVLQRVAGEMGAGPAAVAIAWVQSRPGVSSTMIGARRVDQLLSDFWAD